MGLFSKKNKQEEIEMPLPQITKLVNPQSQDIEQTDYNQEIANQNTSSIKKNEDDEDLFDLEDFGDDEPDTLAQKKETEPTNKVNNFKKGEDQFPDDPSFGNDEDEEEKKEENQGDINFSNMKENLMNEKKKLKKDFFVTTVQFKDLIDIVDYIKSKIKNSNDIYLRLTDLKSEEDIEYENLRKSFSFIEEKLYDLDKIIFNE